MEQRGSVGQQRSEEDSLAPIQLDRLSVEEEVALMNRGKGGRLMGVGLVLVLCALGVNVWMKRMDVSRAYASAALGVEQVSNQDGETFLRCALPGVDPAQLATAERLQSAIERVSDQLGNAYARQLKRCEPLLGRLAPELSALAVPADARMGLSALHAKAQAAHAAWASYGSYLRDSKAPYDYVQAVPQIEKITLAWEAFEAQREQLGSVLRSHR